MTGRQKFITATLGFVLAWIVVGSTAMYAFQSGYDYAYKQSGSISTETVWPKTFEHLVKETK